MDKQESVRIREEIAEIVKDDLVIHPSWKKYGISVDNSPERKADQILSIKIGNLSIGELIELKGKLVKLSDDQSLPEVWTDNPQVGIAVQQDMKDAGFKKVEPL